MTSRMNVDNVEGYPFSIEAVLALDRRELSDVVNKIWTEFRVQTKPILMFL